MAELVTTWKLTPSGWDCTESSDVHRSLPNIQINPDIDVLTQLIYSDVGYSVMEFLSQRECCEISKTNRNLNAFAFEKFGFDQGNQGLDSDSSITDLEKWRYAFPTATTAVLSSGVKFTNEDFVYLEGVTSVFIARQKITNEAFTHLQDVVELEVFDCPNITDVGLSLCTKLKTFRMGMCQGIQRQPFRD